MIVLDGATLTSPDVAAVARRGEQVQLASEARARNAAARGSIAELLERGGALYGATTGVGAYGTALSPTPTASSSSGTWIGRSGVISRPRGPCSTNGPRTRAEDRLRG